jgi:hypothetical protein
LQLQGEDGAPLFSFLTMLAEEDLEDAEKLVEGEFKLIENGSTEEKEDE